MFCQKWPKEVVVTDDEKQLSAKDLKRCKKIVYFEAENGLHLSLPNTMQYLSGVSGIQACVCMSYNTSCNNQNISEQDTGHVLGQA